MCRLSKRSLYRYEAKYREEAFDGIRPMNREKRRSQALPENYDEIDGEAIQLKLKFIYGVSKSHFHAGSTEIGIPSHSIDASSLFVIIRHFASGIKL